MKRSPRQPADLGLEIKKLDFEPLPYFNSSGAMRWRRLAGCTSISERELANASEPVQLPEPIADEITTFLRRRPAGWSVEIDLDPTDPYKIIMRTVPPKPDGAR